MTSSDRRLLLVGFFQHFHVGAMLRRAVPSLGISAQFCDATPVNQASWLIQHINWRFRDRRPSNISSFSDSLVEMCAVYRPEIMVVTGMIPPHAYALRKIRDMKITCVNYLTDDPWNPALRSEWFLETLPLYHMIFSPRQANLNDLANIGCKASYLPFGFDPNLHFLDVCPPHRANEFECDILFYGGADEDRIPYIARLIETGYTVHLYGDYWNRFPQTRRAHKGVAGIQTLRWAVSSAKITLCLVRRANRDGHVMRTFEAAAMGACLLAEDTKEHRAIYGAEGEMVLYFRTIQEMNEKVALLLADDSLRRQLTAKSLDGIAQEKNSYKARLRTMIATSTSEIRSIGIPYGK